MKSGNTSGCQAFLRELGWRDFAIHLLYNFPETTDNPLRLNLRDSRGPTTRGFLQHGNQAELVIRLLMRG